LFSSASADGAATANKHCAKVMKQYQKFIIAIINFIETMNNHLHSFAK